LYLKWRAHLLEIKCKDRKLVARVYGDRRDDYIKWRRRLLERKYARPESSSHLPHHLNTSSLRNSVSTGNLVELGSSSDDESPRNNKVGLQPPSGKTQMKTSASSNELRMMTSLTPPLSTSLPLSSSTLSASQQTLKPPTPSSNDRPSPRPADYSFSGMHHIFAETTQPVTCVAFGWNNNDLLAFGTREGTIIVCAAYYNPRVLVVFRGHTQAITDIKWTTSNNMVISTSLDGTVRVWDRNTGQCHRLIKDAGVCQCCCLNPVSENLFLIADNKGYIKMLNISTGKSVLRVKAFANITSMQFDAIGNFLFAADDKGYVEVYKSTKESGALQLFHKTAVCPGKNITSLSFKSISIDQQNTPSILVNCRDSTLKVFMMKNSQPGTLIQVKEFPVANRKENIRASWCPVRDTACVVTGSDDANIYFYDLRRKEKPCINTLMGHSSTVLDVSWSHDESILASCDTSGMVILWSRKNIEKTT